MPVAALAGPSVLALVMLMARDAREQARGMSLFIAVSSVGASAGLILGGVLTEYVSWRWALLINVPVGALVLLAIGRLVAETHPKPARLDVAGALTATLRLRLAGGLLRRCYPRPGCGADRVDDPCTVEAAARYY